MVTLETVASIHAQRMEKALRHALESENDWVVNFCNVHFWEMYLDFVADSGGSVRVHKELEKAFGVRR